MLVLLWAKIFLEPNVFLTSVTNSESGLGSTFDQAAFNFTKKHKVAVDALM